MQDDSNQPPTVFHYTSLAAAKLIIENRRLWMSSAFCMNDYEEISWGLRQASDYWSSSPQAPNGELVTTSLSKHLREQGVYIASFSAHGDRLSQWRAYSNNGQGVSIGFNFVPPMWLGRITDAVWCFRSGVTFSKVAYGDTSDEHVSRLVENVAMFFDRDLTPLQGPATLGNRETGQALFCASIASIKNAAFDEEDEFRLVYLSNARQLLDSTEDYTVSLPKFRASADRLIDYVEFGFPITSLSEIILGPACRAHESEVKKLLRLNDFPRTVDVRRSTASYVL